MIISHTRRLIIFSNPKTGSESLRAAFGPLAEEPVVPWRHTNWLYPFYPHMPPSEAQRVFQARGWDFHAYTRVTGIRNPYPRLVSLYRMIRRSDRIWKLRQASGLPVPDFATWLRGTRTQGRGGGGHIHQRWRRFGTYSVRAWTHGGGDQSLVSHILRLEHLAQDAGPLLEAFALSADAIPHLNAAGSTEWRDWYDAASRSLVQQRYAEELQAFYPAIHQTVPAIAA